MRVNVYAEEMTDRVEIIAKEIDGHQFTGLRLYLELPATGPDGTQHQGPFMHRPGDDDSSAVTFWGKRDLRVVLRKMLEMLDEHYATRAHDQRPPHPYPFQAESPAAEIEHAKSPRGRTALSWDSGHFSSAAQEEADRKSDRSE